MDDEEFKETLEDNCSFINFSKIPGVNRECIKEFMEKLLELKIDFGNLDIEWIITNSISSVYDAGAYDLSLIDVLVDENTFLENMADTFGVVNPVIYKLICQVANSVENKIITYESRYEFYTNQLNIYNKKLQSELNDSEKQKVKFGVEYFTESLEKLENKKDSKKR